MAAAGSIGGAAISADAAGDASKVQADAAKSAQQLQAEEAQKALDFQKLQWQTQETNMAPWLTAGKGALSNLTGLLKTPGQGLLTPFTDKFVAPTDVTEQNDPGYKFRMAQGEGALENSAAANGSLLSGNTLEAQQKFGQDYASNEYSKVYDRAMQEFRQKYGIFENNQTNTYDRLAALAGTGLTTATSLGQEGQQAADNFGKISLTTGAQQGQDIMNAANATASGYVGGANAWNGGITNGTSSLMQLLLMRQMFSGGARGGSGGGVDTTGGWA